MSDYIVRAAAADNQIRAFAITSREMVEKARQIHNTSPVATAALGRSLSAGAMMGSMEGGAGSSDPSDPGRRPPWRHYGDCRFQGSGKGLRERAGSADPGQ